MGVVFSARSVRYAALRLCSANDVRAATAAKVRFVHQSDPEADERRGTVVGGPFKLTLFSFLVLNPNLIDARRNYPRARRRFGSSPSTPVLPKNQSRRLSEETLAVIAGRIEEWWLGPEEAEGRTSRLMV